ncbi:hypothetical protein M426DRAFT_203208 [Hypoxylon sp. CI-4A]|nr:hypothetical protein M426DRAFT_203208 [Hypoxylon sp. CI-4A]
MMVGDGSRQQLANWRLWQLRGRKKIIRATKDPVALNKLHTEIQSERSVGFHISEADRVPALASIPAFLYTNRPATDSPSHRTSEQTSHSFVKSFPPEIRNLIYYYTVGYPSCRRLYDLYYDLIEDRPRSVSHGMLYHTQVPFRTPSILLLCKQITRETLPLFRTRPFFIDRIPPWIMGNAFPLSFTNFVSVSTLQHLPFVQIKISLGENNDVQSGKIWLEVLDDILGAWAESNSLVRLQIMFKLFNIARPNVWYYELENYEKIVEKLSYFEFRHALKPGLIRWETWVIDCNYAYKLEQRNPIIRAHPDPYIWQGSVIEWV